MGHRVVVVQPAEFVFRKELVTPLRRGRLIITECVALPIHCSSPRGIDRPVRTAEVGVDECAIRIMRGPQVLPEPALPSNLDRRVDVTIVFDIRPARENRGRAAAIIGKGRWTVLLITGVRASGILAQAVVDHIRCRIVIAGFRISAVRHARPDMK